MYQNIIIVLHRYVQYFNIYKHLIINKTFIGDINHKYYIMDLLITAILW